MSLLGSCEVGSQMLCELIAYLSTSTDEVTKTEKSLKTKASKKSNADSQPVLDDKLQPILRTIANAACKLVDPTVRGIRQTDKDLLHQGSASNIMKMIAKQQKKAIELAKRSKNGRLERRRLIRQMKTMTVALRHPVIMRSIQRRVMSRQRRTEPRETSPREMLRTCHAPQRIDSRCSGMTWVTSAFGVF